MVKSLKIWQAFFHVDSDLDHMNIKSVRRSPKGKKNELKQIEIVVRASVVAKKNLKTKQITSEKWPQIRFTSLPSFFSVSKKGAWLSNNGLSHAHFSPHDPMPHPNYLKIPCPAHPAKISAISDLCSVFIQQQLLEKKISL